MTTDTNDLSKKIREAEQLAERVLELKRKSIPRRPIVIEFCGCPKSGKSSCISSLNLFLKRNKFRTKVLTERASVCPITDKYDPSFNIWTACSAIAELVATLSNNSRDYDLIILDRGIIDALCWFNWLKEKEKLDVENFKSFESFLTTNKWRRVIDLVYIFTADPGTSLEREYASLLTRKPGSIMSKSVLGDYKASVERSWKTYSKIFQSVELYDTTEKNLNQVNYDVTMKTLEIISENISEKIGYIARDNFEKKLDTAFKLSKLNISQSNMSFGPRPDVEDDSTAVQPIPIVIFTNKARDKILVVTKNKKNTSSDSPESERLLVYFGGHTRKEDSFATSAETVSEVCRAGLQREIKEETGLNYVPPNFSEFDPLCIWDRSNDRSAKHLAICYLKEIDFGSEKVRIDKNEFVTSGKTKSGKVLELAELVKEKDKLEAWSKLILMNLFGVKFDEQAGLFD